jgi:hypothetical protein
MRKSDPRSLPMSASMRAAAAEMVSIRALPVERSVRSCQHVFLRQLRIRTGANPSRATSRNQPVNRF